MGSLSQAARAYAESGISRFHMPGHKGGELPYPGFGEIAALDLTEIPGLDSLYAAREAIRETERAYAELYGSADCFLSAGGGTLCIQAMLALALKLGEKVLIDRGAHVSAANAMALLDLRSVWVLPQTDPKTGLAEAVTAGQVEACLVRNPDAKAVYVTSTTYFGAMADIRAIAGVCGPRDIPLLVDNAHGAHLVFFSPSRHPVALGADICCDSLHKTLPVLTGGAALHIGRGCYAARAREKLSLFGSTSPSYPVLVSMDGALEYLTSGQAAEGMARTSVRLADIRQRAVERGYLVQDGPLSDPLRLVLGAAPLGYTGEELGAWLRVHRVEPEYAGAGYCVLMASPFNAEEDYVRLEQALESLPVREALPIPKAAMTLPDPALSMREAVFAESETVPVEQAEGRIAGTLIAPCPPGMALVAAGELVDAGTVDVLKNYGISHISVIK